MKSIVSVDRKRKISLTDEIKIGMEVENSRSGEPKSGVGSQPDSSNVTEGSPKGKLRVLNVAAYLLHDKHGLRINSQTKLNAALYLCNGAYQAFNNSQLFVELMCKATSGPKVMEWKKDEIIPTEHLENGDEYGMKLMVVDAVIKYIKERTCDQVVKDVRTDEVVKRTKLGELLDEDMTGHDFRRNKPFYREMRPALQARWDEIAEQFRMKGWGNESDDEVVTWEGDCSFDDQISAKIDGKNDLIEGDNQFEDHTPVDADQKDEEDSCPVRALNVAAYLRHDKHCLGIDSQNKLNAALYLCTGAHQAFDNSALFFEGVYKVKGRPRVMEWKDEIIPTEVLVNNGDDQRHGIAQMVVDGVIKYIKERTCEQVVKDVRADEVVKQTQPGERLDEDLIRDEFHLKPFVREMRPALQAYRNELAKQSRLVEWGDEVVTSEADCAVAASKLNGEFQLEQQAPVESNGPGSDRDMHSAGQKDDEQDCFGNFLSASTVAAYLLHDKHGLRIDSQTKLNAALYLCTGAHQAIHLRPLFVEGVRKLSDGPRVMEWRENAITPTESLVVTGDPNGTKKQILVDLIIQHIKTEGWVAVLESVRSDELLKRTKYGKLLDEDLMVDHFRNNMLFVRQILEGGAQRGFEPGHF